MVAFSQQALCSLIQRLVQTCMIDMCSRNALGEPIVVLVLLIWTKPWWSELDLISSSTSLHHAPMVFGSRAVSSVRNSSLDASSHAAAYNQQRATLDAESLTLPNGVASIHQTDMKRRLIS